MSLARYASFSRPLKPWLAWGVHGAVSAPDYSEWTPWPRREITELFFDLLLQGRMCVKDMVTNHYSSAEAPAAYEGLVRDRSGSLEHRSSIRCHAERSAFSRSEASLVAPREPSCPW